LGPLEPLLKDPDITEIMVNSPTNIYIEREGKISRAAVAFRITIISFRLSIRSFPHWAEN